MPVLPCSIHDMVSGHAALSPSVWLVHHVSVDLHSALFLAAPCCCWIEEVHLAPLPRQTCPVERLPSRHLYEPCGRIAALNLEQLQTTGRPRGTPEPCPEAWHVCAVLPAVVVRQRKPWRRKDGVFIYFEDNAGVIVNPKGEMKGRHLFAFLCWSHNCMCMPQLRH